MVKATGVDHYVLNVSDARASVAWYRDHLGLEPVRLEEWEAGEALFVSMRINEGTIIDLLEAERDGSNVDHVCLVVEAVDLDAVAASGEFDVVAGPSELFGARGLGTGLYVRDPDGNVVELRDYA
jgi:catechol 2,3-dioxygenase-like lactoylglutathione lyase family enzyme